MTQTNSMRIAYFDCFAGVSGDMLLGALLSAGLSFDALRAALSHLSLDDYDLDLQTVVRKDLPGIRIHINQQKVPSLNGSAPSNRANRLTHTAAHVINNSTLPDLIKQTSLAIFRRLAQAEAAIFPHQTVQYFDTQKLESLVTVVGLVSGLSLLGIGRVECSPLHVGSGMAQTADGIIPTLSPVTAEILRAASVPVYGSHIAGELVTPLGAAIITTLASAYGPIPAMKIGSVGYGAGRDDLREAPNLVRLFIGEATGQLQSVPVLPQINAAPAPRPQRIVPAVPVVPSMPQSATERPDIGIAANDGSSAKPITASPYVTSHQEWVNLALKGHQQSGRQRLAS